MQHSVKLKHVKDKAGLPIPGLLCSDIALLEQVAAGWECRIPMRRIGNTRYHEFRPVAMGGEFLIVGTFFSKDGCCVIAERLKAGTHILRDHYQDSIGTAPMIVIPWSTAIADEIAKKINDA